MKTEFPDHPGLSAKLFIAPRRKPGSAAGAGSIEDVNVVAAKLAYIIHAAPLPEDGWLEPDPDGPKLFEGDNLLIKLENPEFKDGLTGWTVTGGATAVPGDKSLTLTRGAAAGALTQAQTGGRQLANRVLGISAKAKGPAGVATPQPSALAGGQGPTAPAGIFPADPATPVDLTAATRLPAASNATFVTLTLPTMATQGQAVTWSDIAVTILDHESDLVPEKPGADLIVLADAPPLPLTLAVNGTARILQTDNPAATLTGLGWGDRLAAPRKTEGGDFATMTQALPDDFRNSYYNGYRREALAAGAPSHLTPGDAVTLSRKGATDLYGFTLPPDVPVLRHAWFTGDGPDDPANWPHRDVIPALDTLVIEPDRNRAYVVWRSAFPVTGDPPAVTKADQHRLIRLTMEGM